MVSCNEDIEGEKMRQFCLVVVHIGAIDSSFLIDGVWLKLCQGSQRDRSVHRYSTVDQTRK